MKKFLIIFSLVAAVALGGYQSVARADTQSEGAISQNRDLCGGTHGNGQIVNIGNNEFTLKRHDSGNNQIIHLSDHARIETSAGLATLSDLKSGDNVTLVGGPNKDGSFTADTVVLCAGTQENETVQANPIAPRSGNPAQYEKVSGTINTVTVLIVSLVWLGIAVFLLLKKKKSIVYLLFFTILYVYLYIVLDYTLIQFQSLLLLHHFVPDLMLSGVEAGKSMNLIPLATLRLEDLKTSLLNILMMIPFGFGLPFITNFRFRKVVVAGLFLSIGIELLQLITGFTANTTFRVADINDLIFNTIGVTVGYMLFVQFVRIYRRVSHNRKNPILRYIADRPQIEKSASSFNN